MSTYKTISEAVEYPLKLWIILGVAAVIGLVFFDASIYNAAFCLGTANFFLGVKYICAAIELTTHKPDKE